MRRGIDQRAVVVLAVDLDQRAAELAHHLDADRLIVDESAGAAIRQLDAAQDQFVIRGDVVVLQQRTRRMLGRDLEHGNDLTLLDALAHQALVAAAAQRQGETVEQDRLAGTGFAGKDREALGEIDVEPVDQHDIANGQTGEHGSANPVNNAIIKDADGRHKAGVGV